MVMNYEGNAMKTYLCCALALVCTAIYAADVTLKSGKVLKDAELQGVDDKGISFYYERQTKVTTVNPDQLTDADRKKYAWAIDEYSQKKTKLQKDALKARRIALLKKNLLNFDGEIFQIIPNGGLAKLPNPYAAEIANIKSILRGVSSNYSHRQSLEDSVAELTRKSDDWEMRGGLIFIENLPDGMTDGTKWKGRIFRCGTYRYQAVNGAARTIARYTTSAKKAVEYYEGQQVVSAK